MNKYLLAKAGPIAGVILTLMTTGFTGYKIFAAPLPHTQEVPSLPSPTPVKGQEVVVETVIEEQDEQGRIAVKPSVLVSVSPTPTIVRRPTGSAVAASVKDDADGDDDSKFDDSDDDHLSLGSERVSVEEKLEVEHETPEPTKSPER